MIFRVIYLSALLVICASAQDIESFIAKARAIRGYDDNICDGLGLDEPAFLANTRGCSWFHVCVDGVHSGQNRCPNGFHFHEEEGGCAAKGSFECTINHPDVVAKCPEDRGLHVVPHPYSCSKYIVCFDGVENDRDCEAGLHYSPYDEECVEAFLADCSIEVQACKESIETGLPVLLPNSRDCSSFFVCIGDRSAELTCAPDTVFNPAEGYCDVPTDPPSTECTVPDHTVNIPDKIDIYCDGLSGVMVPHPEPEYCQFFFFCAGDRSYLGVCGEGLRFDTVSFRCELESTATCLTLD